ncbi:CYTH-like domain-containing protein, partial [Globomyces pollinis-pini]
IEGKLGIITDKHTQRRIQLPVQSETSNNVLFNIKVFKNDRNQCFFKSDMTMAQHACFNQLLNSLVNPNSKVKYVHLKEIDQFYNIRGIGKVRQTIDQKSKKIKNCILKTKVENLEIYMPNSQLDCRISVNIETQLTLPEELKSPDFERQKDRVSYSLSPFQIDLTQVKSNANGTDDVMHELEIELTDINEFTNDIQLEGPPSKRVLDTIDAFMNNIRILSRKAK